MNEPNEAELPVPEWHKAILDARLKDMEENPDDWVSWDEAMAKLFAPRAG